MKEPVWIFDLDNTLHDADPHIFPHINQAMTAYVARELGLSEADASALRASYWQRYGATLLGLMRHHGTDPHEFLASTHNFPALARMLRAERQLGHSLRRLSGRKLVFSNAPHAYAHAVLRALKIDQFFDAVYSIESTRFQPKPAFSGFRRLLYERRLNAERCVMVDDSLANLRAAKWLGMRTVWVARRIHRPSYVDLVVRSICELPRLKRSLF